jgi:hypothetical protein
LIGILLETVKRKDDVMWFFSGSVLMLGVFLVAFAGLSA